MFTKNLGQNCSKSPHRTVRGNARRFWMVQDAVSCESWFDHTDWLWKKWELFSQTQKNYPIRSRGRYALLLSPRDTVSRKKAKYHKNFTNQKRKISPLRKQRDILHKHLENRISKAQIKIVNNLSETAKNCCFYALGLRGRELWRNCKPFPIPLWNFTNAQWEGKRGWKGIEKVYKLFGAMKPKKSA